MQSVNSAQFSNITCLFSLYLVVNAAVAPTPTTVKVPLTSIYASYNHTNLSFKLKF